MLKHFSRYFSTAVVVSLFVLVASCSSSEPATFDGSWKSADDTLMSAVIEDGVITILWDNEDDSTALYWKGTVPSETTDTFVSQGDTEAMEAALLGSTSKTKAFTYEDGKLSFEVSLMAVTRTVTLER